MHSEPSSAATTGHKLLVVREVEAAPAVLDYFLSKPAPVIALAQSCRSSFWRSRRPQYGQRLSQAEFKGRPEHRPTPCEASVAGTCQDRGNPGIQGLP